MCVGSKQPGNSDPSLCFLLEFPASGPFSGSQRRSFLFSTCLLGKASWCLRVYHCGSYDQVGEKDDPRRLPLVFGRMHCAVSRYQSQKQGEVSCQHYHRTGFYFDCRRGPAFPYLKPGARLCACLTGGFGDGSQVNTPAFCNLLVWVEPGKTHASLVYRMVHQALKPQARGWSTSCRHDEGSPCFLLEKGARLAGCLLTEQPSPSIGFHEFGEAIARCARESLLSWASFGEARLLKMHCARLEISAY